MREAAPSSKRIVRVTKVAALLLAAVGLTVLAVATVPALRSYATTLPVLQDIRLFLFNLGPPSRSGVGSRDARATEITLHDPMGIAEDSAGNIFVADRGRWFGLAAIWKIDRDGMARLVAGTGRRGAVRAGIEGLRSDLGMPEGLTIDHLDRAYFADSINHVVMRIESDGRLTRIAGTGAPGFAGDFGPAREAALRQPYDIRLDSRGNVYIADYGNNRIRMVTPDGTIRTVAGNGEQGYSGDGGPATAARLNGPYGIFLDREDSLLIADSFNHVVRKVTGEGIITTVYGSGRQGYAGDGGPASAAAFDTPQSLYVDGDGRTFIGDEHNHAIRLVTPDGRISTLIGTGAAGFSEDGVLAAGAALNDPEYLFVREDGSVVLSEGDNRRVLIINQDGTLHTFAGERARR